MILVTGATGNVGAAFVRIAAARNAAVRVPTRQTFDFLRPDTYDAAVTGCRALFLLRPPAVSNVKPTLNVLIDRARAAGVSSIVFVSVAGAEKNVLVPHHAVEQHLMRGPSDWTILRPGFFAQNFGDAYVRDIREDHRIYVPAGRGVAAFVDVRDVAEVALMAVSDPVHRGRAYTLTGPEAVSFAEAAELLSHEIERTIRYEAASLVGYVRHLARRGMPAKQIAVQTVLHAGLRLGQAARIDPTLQALLARPPRRLAEYFRDHAGVFTSPPAHPVGS